MSDNAIAAAEPNAQPFFQIQRVYLKDLSLEQPNSPQIFLETQQPQVDIQVGVDGGMIAEGIYESTVTATVTAKIGDKVMFLAEGKQAGIFEIRNVPQEQMPLLLGVACPQIIYPYLRANLADAISKGSFPPIHLAELNFQAMFEAQQQQQAEAASAQQALALN